MVDSILCLLTNFIIYPKIFMCHSFRLKGQSMKNTSNYLTTDHKRENVLLNESPKRKLEELNMIDAFLFDKATASVKNAITISKIIINRLSIRNCYPRIHHFENFPTSL